MNVSIIIPTLNEAHRIGQAVEWAWANGPHEVLVVDGDSCDETTAVAERQGARVLRGVRGRASQQNLGAAEATGDVLLFLHADNLLGPDGVRQIVHVLKNPAVLGGAFRQQIAAPGLSYRLLERGNALRARLLGLPYGDQGIFLRREVFQRLGGFPEVALMEDLLLMRKLRRRSRPVLLPGPLRVSPRRWQKSGVVRQTLRNWSLLAAEGLGVSPSSLARFYPPHSDGS